MYIINPLTNGKTEIQQDEFDKYFPHLKNGKTFYMEKRDEDFYIETTLGGAELISTVQNAESMGKYVIKRVPPKENKNQENLIKELLQKGSGFVNGKFRIYEYYTEDNKDFASFLKKEYGDGGGTIDNGGISYNAKGFRVKIERAELPEDNFDLTLGWANVANRIGQIIDRGEYFTEQEEEKYAIWKREKEELEEMKEIERWEREAKATARAQEQAKAEYTPEYQAYLKAQEKYPDAIVLQRVGDFYEVLGENAKILAGEMDLTLVSREVSDKERQPMIGFPWYIEAQYLAKINENHTAVILDGEEERYLPKFDLDKEVEKLLDEKSVEELENLLDISRQDLTLDERNVLGERTTIEADAEASIMRYEKEQELQQVKTARSTVEIKNTKKGGKTEMNNQVKLQARVKYNVELKKSSGGKDYVNVPVEVDRIQGDELKTDTFYISAFGQAAEDFAKFKKGDVVKIGGRLEQSTYNGQTKLGIIATNVSKAENDNASNIVTLSGFVNNKKLEIKQSESGKEYATIALGVKNHAGEYETYFVNAFGGTAKRAVAYKHRDLVSFEGFLQNTDGRLGVTAQRSELLRTFDDKLKAEKEKAQENVREENEEENN